MKRFLLSVMPQDGLVRITGEDYHYLARVRRYSEGGVFKGLLANGKHVRLLVQKNYGKSLLCECTEDMVPELGSLPHIVLFQALAKGARTDQIFRQATEAGVELVVPFISEYCVSRLEHGKTERWKRIVKEARQQSGSEVDTQVGELCDAASIPALWNQLKHGHQHPAGLLFHQSPLGSASLHGVLRDCDFAALLIGPEGGFSIGEAKIFMDAGFVPLVLGQSVMRVETAAVYAIGAVRTILLEAEEWKK